MMNIIDIGKLDENVILSELINEASKYAGPTIEKIQII